MAECPHKVIEAYVKRTEYGGFVSSGWRCTWCQYDFIPSPENKPHSLLRQEERNGSSHA